MARATSPEPAEPTTTDAAVTLTSPHSSRGVADVSGPFIVTGHERLYDDSERRCDACEAALPEPGSVTDEDSAEGSGLYVWVRHGSVVYEEPPLCPSCAAAITLSALQRWETEEDEG